MTEELVKDSTQPVTPITQRPKKGRGLGCWITGITTLIVAVGLVAVGLLLPPFNLADRLFGPQYAMLSSESNAAGLGGLAVVAWTIEAAGGPALRPPPALRSPALWWSLLGAAALGFTIWRNL